jgi:hypothetical protein
MNTTLTTPNPPTNGDLNGVPPTIFDGDQSKVQRFVTQFGLFWIVNETNPVISNPKRRVALALTYIRGPRVDNWVSQQFNALLMKISGDANHPPKHAMDEALWEEFITEFKNTRWLF